MTNPSTLACAKMDTNLSILHLNVRSITAPDKKAQLAHLIHLHNPDFISLNETFLKPHHPLEVAGYTVFRHDRLIRKGGGTALCVRSSIRDKQIDLANLVQDEYAVGFLAKTAYGDIAIFSLHITPSSQALNLNLLSYITKFGKFILAGDLNAKSKLWHCPIDNKRGLELEELLSKSNLQLLNSKKATFKSSKSVLDLSICSNSMKSKFKKFSVLNDLISDHQPTVTIFKITTEKLKFVIKKIDFDLLYKTLETNCPNPVLSDSASIDRAAAALELTFTNALTLATRSITISKPSLHAIEIPRIILDLIRVKRKARRALTKHNSPEARSFFNDLNRQVKASLSKFKQANLESKFSDLKHFNQSCSKHWKTINSLQHNEPASTLPTTLLANDVAYLDNQEIAEKFGTILSATFGITTHLKDLQQFPIPITYEDITISQAEFNAAIKASNKKSAPGIDGISTRLISTSPSNIKALILSIYQFSLRLGHMPKSWKIAKIKMIHKRGKPKNDFTSYRPISLLVCLSKLLEKIINKKITIWAEANNIFPPEQSGFRTKRSCQDHILRLTQQITNGFNDVDDKKLTGAIFFDLEKAFDVAPHSGIINKLEKNKLNPCLINWVKSFLTDRSYQVNWQNNNSNFFLIKRGVPQGSCLSPTLFNIYFSDITKVIPKSIDKALFADDLGIWHSDASLKVIEFNLQRAVIKIVDYCAKWGLLLSKKKTFYTVFCPAGLRANYHRIYGLNLSLNDTRIPLEPNPTFLGITLDPKLNFKAHLANMEKKIASKVNLFKKIKGLRINHIKINSILFKSLVRPVFDYAFIALCSPTQRIMDATQKIQNRILRAIKYFPPLTRIADIHIYFKIKSVGARSTELLKKFALAKRDHDLISSELSEFVSDTLPRDRKFDTTFDKLIRFQAGEALGN